MTGPLYIAEPRQAYASRPPLVVDASVVCAALFHEQRADVAHAWMQGRALNAPALIDWEVVNVALSKTRRGSLRPDDATGALADFMDMDLERHRTPADEVYRLGVRYELTAYDACYLWLADRLQAPLATLDAKLAAAARAHLDTDRRGPGDAGGASLR